MYEEFRDECVISDFSSNTLKLNWVPWKLLSFLQPTTISSEIKYEYPWIKVTEFMADHSRIRSKIKLRLFTFVCLPLHSIEPTIEWSLIIEVEEKPYCSSVSMVWWDEYHEFSQNSNLEGTDQKSCSFWPAKAFTKTDVDRNYLNT